MRRALWLLFALGSCTESGRDARELEVANVIAKADEALIRSRPRLVAGKYARMAASPVAFIRGTVPLVWHDMRSASSFAGDSAFALSVPLVPSIGDAHLENFGTLRASDGTFSLEPNDVDAADDAPYLWDVRRLAAGLALAARLSNPDDEQARQRAVAAQADIVRAAARGYLQALRALSEGQPPPRITHHGDNAILEDAFSRSVRDLERRRELANLTKLDGDSRTILRGELDPEDSENVASGSSFGRVPSGDPNGTFKSDTPTPGSANAAN